MTRRARPLVARRDDGRRYRAVVRAGGDGRRGPSLHPLHPGSTGKPKGVLHTTAGYLLHCALSHKVDMSTYMTTTYGGARPTSAGSPATAISSTAAAQTAPPRSCSRVSRPTRTPDRFWPALREGQGHRLLHRPDGGPSASLMRLGDMGPRPPTSPRCASWARSESRSTPMCGSGTTTTSAAPGARSCDTWWQTETGAILITPLAGATPMRPGSASFPFFGVDPVVLRQDGTEASVNQSVGSSAWDPWPGMMRTLYGAARAVSSQTYYAHVSRVST